jgi:hypothetical protein
MDEMKYRVLYEPREKYYFVQRKWTLWPFWWTWGNNSEYGHGTYKFETPEAAEDKVEQHWKDNHTRAIVITEAEL